jgi:two-component system KDP operon response regulator KdpE
VPSVLIIDDYVPTTETFAKVLTLEGFEAATAVTGDAGLRAAAERAFDVILVDLRLPDIPGTDVVAELRRRGVSARIVIV